MMPNLSQAFSLETNHLTIKGGESDYFLNPIGDTHWYKGTVAHGDIVANTQGIKFDNSFIKGIENVSANKNSVFVDFGFGQIEYTNFKLIDGGITFTGVDEINNVHQEIEWVDNYLNFDENSSLAIQFYSLYSTVLEREVGLTPSKLTWSCVVGGAIVAAGAAYAATIAHCNNVIATVANNCNACVEASFCSATCVSCPPQQ